METPLLFRFSKQRTGPLVNTKLGLLRGQYKAVKGQEADVQTYFGIPFAKPPVGELRLAPPLPAEGWEGTKDATKQPFICIQNKVVLEGLMELLDMQVELPDMSEDCLYLNVFAPGKAAPGTNLPVMVWIHGGGFAGGCAATYDTSGLAAYQDVVVVVIQYRLGLLGFLSSGDEAIPGNLGLLDQVEALRWVQQNIHHFGGDPGLVTIFGESAGGISVSLLAISPLSAGLFQHAIAQSGTAAMEILMTDQPETTLQTVANTLGCDTSSEKIARCLKNMDIDALAALSLDPTLSFPVTVDGLFMTEKVNKTYQDGKIPKIPFLTGVNSDEGGWLLPYIFAPTNWTEGMDREPTIAILSIFYPEPNSLELEMMVEEYFGTTEDRNEIRQAFTNLLGDVMFNIPAIQTANAHRDAGAPVYLYQYRYAPQYLRKKRPSFVGVDHGDEIFTVLGSCFMTDPVWPPDVCTEEEMELTKLMMTYWGNFARTGNPNGPGLVAWPQYGPGEDYLSIGMVQEPLQHLARDRFTFITQTLPEKIAAAQKEQTARPEL
ncbi:Pyrethroid hydrolase Ces2e [Merluccius polli]|uniref:Carboxylic ester hydrolase n=1 Tax=Merluccius polli TaxID=89951 RepID=A0AA47MQB0_MERPO|nr:Pyrethroid hydrolase Ces2e [Merluccius polli]